MNCKYLIFGIKVLWRHFLWICGALCCIKMSKKASLFSDLKRRILIVAPHADDEWVGCSQIIRKGEKVHVLYLDFPQIHKDKNAAERRDELMMCCAKQGVELSFRKETGTLHQRIFDVVKTNNIEQIFIPSFWDWHADHLQAVRSVCLAIGLLDRPVDLYCYQVSCPILSTENMYYLRIQDKWGKFGEYYKSQHNLPVFRFKIHEVLNGIFYRIGVVSIEVYKKIDVVKLEKEDVSINMSLGAKINDIALIRKESEVYFNSVNV